jgi:alpha-D-ribose 1-methylphosphonate 5-triphosphate diphosphatase
MSQIIYKNARIVLRDEVVQGVVVMNNGVIASVDTGSTAVSQGHDLEGDYLMPGFVEIHTDNFERHLMPRPKVHWAEIPALLAHDAEVVASGITTVYDALGVGDADPESVRGKTWNEVLKALEDCTQKNLLRADHYLHVRCELPAPNTIDLFEPFRNHPRLSLISLMDHTPGQRQWENIEQAQIYFTGKKGWSLEKFEKQVGLSGELQAKYAKPQREYFVGYCKEHGIAMASHDDTTTAHVLQAHAEGASMSEFPTTLQAAHKARELGMQNVMGGPNVVRGGSHSGNVCASELARHGLLDILSSDYVPSSLLSAVMRLVRERILTLPQAVALVSDHPAQATGMLDRGRVEPGLRADLIQVRTINMTDDKQHAVVRGVWRAGRQVM